LGWMSSGFIICRYDPYKCWLKLKSSQRWYNGRARDQLFAPTPQVGEVIVDGYPVTLTPDIEGYERNVGQRIIAHDVFLAGHFPLQRLEMLVHPLFCFIGFFIMCDIMRRWMDPTVEEVNPDPCLRP